jgi:hypothetical protein
MRYTTAWWLGIICSMFFMFICAYLLKRSMNVDGVFIDKAFLLTGMILNGTTLFLLSWCSKSPHIEK